MHTYSPQKFSIPTLKGISQKQIDIHLVLYDGYVKHVNLIRERIQELNTEPEKNNYLASEIRRRFAFEFNGMRLHEFYFTSFEGGSKEANTESELAKSVSEKYGSWQKFIEHFTTVGLTRGNGWSILYYDPIGKTPHVIWVDEHHIGHLGSLPVILAMDMWEHAYMVDYLPAQKKEHITAFLSNINWETVEKRLKEVI
ncbi:MAG: Fe-Mn family superoxide dismutase [Patescibacteria group bacterium]|nr:Fe-Mn family superoxide dismutase [bacterium]MDZ4241120.1 Fe-Mn family superoxide dismutase [Patescibacteria group bacterium]